MRAFTLTLVLAVTGFAAAAADPAARIEVAGAVQRPGVIILSELPATIVKVDQVTSGKPFQGAFTGPRLWDILARANVIDPGKGGLLQRTLTVTARDGYAVVLSYSEINPDYGNNEAIIALSPTEAPRLIIPKDKRAGRAVRNVVKIEVK